MAYGLTKSAHFVAASTQWLSNVTHLGIATNLTLEGWVNPASQPSSGASMTAFGVRGTTNKNLAAISYQNTAGTTQLNFECNLDNTAGLSVTFNTTLTTGTWYHIAITFNGTTIIGYLNGVQVATVGGGGTGGSSNDNFFIGRHPNTGLVQYWDGNISLVRGWTTVLAAATILANMCNVYGTPTTNLAGEWSLDNVLTDASGNAVTLTNNNATTFTTSTPSTCAVSVNAGFLAFI